MIDDPPPAPPPHDHDDPAVEPVTLEASLYAYARKAAEAANRLTPDATASVVPGHAVDALAYMRAANEALRARQLADEQPPASDLDAAAAVIRSLRDQVSGRERQRDDLATFLEKLADELESADTHPARRFAARIRRELAAIVPDADERREAAEAAGEDVPA
jgi:hypothetical protein